MWCTQRFAGHRSCSSTLKRRLQSSGDPDRWAEAYFPIAKRHDEFDYLNKPDITIHIDSKENFDSNSSGNWYYYFK